MLEAGSLVGLPESPAERIEDLGDMDDAQLRDFKIVRDMSGAKPKRSNLDQSLTDAAAASSTSYSALD